MPHGADRVLRESASGLAPEADLRRETGMRKQGALAAGVLKLAPMAAAQAGTGGTQLERCCLGRYSREDLREGGARGSPCGELPEGEGGWGPWGPLWWAA